MIVNFIRCVLMKKILLLIIFSCCVVICNAQLQPPVQTDTLIITNVKYQYSNILKENWPFTTIYKSTSSFTLGDKKFKITNVEKTQGGILYTITDLPMATDTTYNLVYTEQNEQMRIFFSGYEFSCRPNRVQPSFYFAGITDFADWVNRHLNYPEAAIQKEIEGQVMLRFVVDSDGYVKNVQVIESVNPILDKEAVRVVSSSPKWTPGMFGETPIATWYDFPVIFKLTDSIY